MATSTSSHCHQVTVANFRTFNYYELLGIDRGSSGEPIDMAILRRNYRRLGLRFHPDKDSSPEARSVFERLTTAAETLGDPAARAVYDRELDSRDVGLRVRAQGLATAASAEERLQRAEEAVEREKQRGNAAAAATLGGASSLAQSIREHLFPPWKALEAEMIDAWDIGMAELSGKERDVAAMIFKNCPEGARNRAMRKRTRGDENNGSTDN